jgi:rhodanese-related sulfurtransferase
MNMIQKTSLISGLFLTLSLGISHTAFADKVGITPDLPKVEGTLAGKKILIQRDQNTKNTVNPAFAKTSRPCPPFCIQPATLAPGVDTIGEVEVIQYLQQMMSGDTSVLVVDSRTPDWVKRGTIPGAKNIPWTKLSPSADPFTISEILSNEFGAREAEGLWDFSQAKTLVLFCNGMWCGQSPNNIKNLLRFGYPAHKIKWYRGGMQNWEILGLSTVKP